MNEKQAHRAVRFTSKLVKQYPGTPVVFGVESVGEYGSITVFAFESGEKESFASMFINRNGQGSLRATGMSAHLRGKIRG